MNKLSNLTTKGLGFFLNLASFAFVITLLIYTLTALKPVTETRIADCAELVQSYSEKLEQEKAKADASEDDIKYIENRIATYSSRMEMLKSREKYYSVSMVFIACVLLLGATVLSVKTSTLRKKYFYGGKEISYRYDPLISAPLCAFCILLAIGVTYRAIFSVELFDFITLVCAVTVGFIVFMIQRRSLYISARFEKIKIKGKFTLSDVMFCLPILGILVLLVANFLFGATINGAKLWINVFGVLLQPGEFIKVLLIIAFASSYGKMWRAVTSVITGGISMLALLLLHDMGTAIVIFAMVLVMLLLLLDNKMTFSWLENKKLFLIILLLAVCLLIVSLTFLDYARERILNVGTAMEKDAQQSQMLKALIFGGVGGLGIENSSYIINIYAIDSDMAIAGITSVFGVGMLLIALLCYALLIIIPIRKYSIYRSSYFITAQVSVVLFIQVIFNALGSIDVLPFTGIVAPFLSNGGSALTCFCAMIGLVLATLYPVIKPLEVDYQ